MSLFSILGEYITPFFIGTIIICGMREKIKIFDVFTDGAKEGIKVIIRIFPTLIGIFLAIGIFRASGLTDFITNLVRPVLNLINYPAEIMPLVLIRPISGSGAIGVATDIIKKYGTDSYIGNVASVIMGATETTLYTIAIYTSGLNVEKSNKLLVAALTADAVGILVAVEICRFLS